MIHLQWNETNHTSPAKPNTTQIEQRVVKTVRAALDFREDLSIMLGETWRNGLATLLFLFPECATEPRSGNLFEVGILKQAKYLD